MTLSRGEVIGLICAFGAVVLSAIIHIGIREWYQPDVRFEEGGYYISENSAITSLRITNHGHSDAEGIVAVVAFGLPIRNISVGSSAVSFKVNSGKIGDQALAVSVDRLVPKQSASIFFAIDSQGTPRSSLPSNFLVSITYKGGIGKTGEPEWIIRSATIFFVVFIYIPLLIAALSYIRGIFDKQRKPHYKRISEMIELALEAHDTGLTRDDVVAKAESATSNVSFRPLTLREVAVRMYDAIEKKRSKSVD